MKSLDQQRIKIESVVNIIHSNNQEATSGLEKLNENLD